MALPTSSILLDLAAVIQRIADLFGLDSEVVRRNGVRILIIWITAFVIHQMIRIIAARIVRRASDSNDKLLTHREKRASTISGVMRGVGGALVILFAVILTLDVFINIGPLLAGAGVAGLAISFGSQSLVRDVISGFFLLIENQFDVGDVVDLAGLSGSVEHMTLRVTQLRDVEGAVHLIPNGQILTVTNRTRGWSRAVVDIATLTGASVVAIGSGVASSLFANDAALRARLETAAEATAESVWHMPLFDDYRQTIESKVADLKNTGGAQGGVGTSAVFLEAFTDYPWAHVDMAGMALIESAKGKNYLSHGATGYGVRLFVEFLRDWA